MRRSRFTEEQIIGILKQRQARSGELITVANAKNIPSHALFSCGLFKDVKGKAGLILREELPCDRQPNTDKNRTVWNACSIPRAC